MNISLYKVGNIEYSISDDNEMYISKDWYVARGTYRLKLTHTAIDSSDKIVETVIKYSNIVVY